MLKFLNRTLKTSEIIISRVFFSGCGWNGGSIIGENLDYNIFDYEFFMLTGCCQSISVMTGHILYSKIKSNFRDINMNLEYKKSLQIGSATFLSGYIWQPTVNFLENYDFSTISTITGLTCGTTFCTGLIITRYIFPLVKITVDKNSSSTLKRDIGVSSSIAGATGLSVSTDTTITNNYMVDYFGITTDYTVMDSLIMAGTVNACGFLALQTLQNMKRNTWLD